MPETKMDVSDPPPSPRRYLTSGETRNDFWATQIAGLLGRLHLSQGILTVPPIYQAPLIYYRMARERQKQAQETSSLWLPKTAALAGRAAVRLEDIIRQLLRKPSQELLTMYNFYGGSLVHSADGALAHGTIIVEGNQIISLNDDPVTSRSAEPHNNIAILARWTHMQGYLGDPSLELDAQQLSVHIFGQTLLPYYEGLAGRIPTASETEQFWLFLDLEYTEYWFYFLQVGDAKAVYQMTLALQRLEIIRDAWTCPVPFMGRMQSKF